ncbi:MAG TPA: 23S rRNA (guanosine(2251)-2'-O)-methyltransferase RlmB [Ktedonobacterales bacterium]|jgi:23S rRNA (guanosine2251-2'-O)-methyltransferase
MADYVWGRNPVLETLRSNRKVYRLLLAEGTREAGVQDLLSEAERRHVPVEYTPRRRLDDLTRGAVHQGCVASVAPRDYASLEDILALAEQRGEPPLLLMLDSIQDIHNLGSLLRTAEAVGAHGLILPEHRAAGLTPAVDKSSAGAVEHLLVAQVTNLTRAVDTLKKRGIWVVGLAGEATQDYDRVDLDRPLALVVGSEGKGISRLVREHCDFLVRLPMRGQINSLNAAVAGSIVLYAAWRQRAKPDQPHA